MEKIKDFLGGVFGLIIFLGLMLLPLLVILGGVWLSGVLYPFLVSIFSITFIVSIFILLPLGIFKKTRLISSNGLLIASYVFGTTLWVWSFLLSYALWGFLGLLIGLFIAGIGVIPIAVLATLFSGEWAIFGQLILLVFVTFGSRIFASYIGEEEE
jgi:hypothetical protein